MVRGILLSSSDYDSKFYSENYEVGKIKNINRFKFSMNYSILKTRKFIVTPSIRYKYESFEFENVENNSVNYPILYHTNSEDFHYILPSLNTTHLSKLFNKPMMYSFNLSVDISDKGYEYMAATLVGIIILKKDMHKTISLGVIISFDKMSLLPIIPFFSYEYKFRNSLWVFDAYLPKYVYFRKSLFINGRLSLGTRLDGDRFFGYPKREELDNLYNVVKRELKTGFKYEHFINNHFILSINAGIANTIQWKVTKQTSRKAIISYSPDMNLFLNVGFSYNL